MDEQVLSTIIYNKRRIETLYDPFRYKTCVRSYETIKRFIKFHGFESKNSKHLDLGCGDRCLSKVYADNGWVSEGIDISDGVNFEKDPLPFSDGQFKLITLYGVIEHIGNPYNIITEIHRILDKGGVCVIITTNVSSEGFTFYDDPDHKKAYTPRGLSWLMQMYNFDPCKVGLWTVGKPAFIWSLPWRLQFLIGKLFPFSGRTKFVPNFLKGKSRTMIGMFVKR